MAAAEATVLILLFLFLVLSHSKAVRKVLLVGDIVAHSVFLLPWLVLVFEIHLLLLGVYEYEVNGS